MNQNNTNEAQKDAELHFQIQQQLESQLFDSQAYKEWLAEQKQNEEDHDWKNLERLDQNTMLQICVICDLQRVVELVGEVSCC